MTPRLVFRAASLVGESPLWAPDEGRLYWLDQNVPAMHRFDPSSGRNETWELPLDPPVGGLVRSIRGCIICAPKGVFLCDFDRRALKRWIDPNLRPRDTCFNDAKVDRDGHLWISSMHITESRRRGQLYRIQADGRSTVIDQGFTCGNGPAFSPDGQLLYFADTGGGRVLVYELNRATGETSNRRVFAKFSADEGQPDGMTVDSQGSLWVCHWRGWGISRLLANGRRDLKLRLPVPNVTSCCFGSGDLGTLFVTTASAQMAPDDATVAPLAGSIFAIDPGVAGLVEPIFAVRTSGRPV